MLEAETSACSLPAYSVLFYFLLVKSCVPLKTVGNECDGDLGS